MKSGLKRRNSQMCAVSKIWETLERFIAGIIWEDWNEVWVKQVGISCVWICVLCICFPGGASGKEAVSHRRRHKRCGSDPWAGKTPWKRARQSISVILSGESHGQRSLVGYSSWGHEEWGMTEATACARCVHWIKRSKTGIATWAGKCDPKR